MSQVLRLRSPILRFPIRACTSPPRRSGTGSGRQVCASGRGWRPMLPRRKRQHSSGTCRACPTRNFTVAASRARRLREMSVGSAADRRRRFSINLILRQPNTAQWSDLAGNGGVTFLRGWALIPTLEVPPFSTERLQYGRSSPVITGSVLRLSQHVTGFITVCADPEPLPPCIKSAGST